MTWQLVLDVSDPDDRAPLFTRIAQAISRDIARGRLRPGQRLPGTRTLAASLGVNRNTVVAAIDELVAQGWVETRPAKGCFVRDIAARAERPRPLARSLAPRPGMPASPAYPLSRPDAASRAGPRPASGPHWVPGAGGAPCDTPEPAVARDALVLAGGVPDPRLFPGDLLARAYRRIMKHHAEAVLDYGDPHGYHRLRAALAEMLADTRGLATSPDEVFITRGSQMALWLIGRVLLRAGDRVAVESHGYVPGWNALRQSGATLCPVPVDSEGMDIGALETLIAGGPLRAVYLTPHHQYPTMATLSAARRLRLLALAKEHGFVVIEDDYDNEYHYEGRPVLPLASADTTGSVVYIGTLSKVLAPGLRIGYVAAPRPVLEHMAAERLLIDRQGDSPTEAAVAELLEDGEVQRHIRRTRRIYHDRRDALAEHLDTQLGHVLRFDVPRGGMAFWLHVDAAIDVDRWAASSQNRGVIFTPGRLVSFDGAPTPHIRIGYARVDQAEIAHAVRILRSALPRRP